MGYLLLIDSFTNIFEVKSNSPINVCFLHYILLHARHLLFSSFFSQLYKLFFFLITWSNYPARQMKSFECGWVTICEKVQNVCAEVAVEVIRQRMHRSGPARHTLPCHTAEAAIQRGFFFFLLLTHFDLFSSKVFALSSRGATENDISQGCC